MCAAERQNIFLPETMADLLMKLRQYPEGIISAGHTWLSTNAISRIRIRTSDVISLRRVEELNRIFRSERVLDIGCMVNFQRLLQMEPGFLPDGLRYALLRTVPFPTRSLATIGGNLCIEERIPNLLPVLISWKARLEIRKQGGTRTILAQELFSRQQDIQLDPGELLTRIKIPLAYWTHQFYERIDPDQSIGVPSIFACHLARIPATSIDEIRLCFGISNLDYICFENLDIQLVGLKLPLSTKEITSYLHGLDTQLNNPEYDQYKCVKVRIIGLARYYLKNLHRLQSHIKDPDYSTYRA